MKRFFTTLGLALLAVGGGIVSAQPLEHIAEVKTLNRGEAARNPRQVKLQGVVTHVAMDKTLVTINDGAHGIGISLPPGMSCPSLADKVEVEGQAVIYVVAGFSHPRVLADRVRVIGPGKLPEPQKLTLPELNSFRHFEKWVSVEGHVSKWKFHPSGNELTIAIVGPTTWTTVTVLTAERPAFADHLMGARLRFAGINAGRNTHNAQGALIVPSLAQVEILKQGWKSSFDAPLVTMPDIKAEKVEPESRVKVRGVVVAHRDTLVYLRGEEGAQVDNLQSPWERPAAGDEELADAGPWTALSHGDEVELVGSVGISGGRVLSYCDVRVIGRQEVPKPEHVEIETLRAYENKDDWVSVEGSVVAWTLQNGLMSYIIQGPHGSLFFNVPDSTAFPSDLFGAHVRVTGITRRMPRGTDFYPPNPSFVEILRPGKADRFDVPEYSPGDITKDRAPLGELVKTKGVLLGRDGRALYIRGKDSSLRVNLQQPWNRPAGGASMFFADGGPLPELKTGDELELSGSAVRPKTGQTFAPFDLISVSARVIGRQDKIEPVPTTLTRIINGEHASDLVQVRGRVLMTGLLAMDQGEWRTMMMLDADGARLPVFCQGPGRLSFNTVKVDDEVVVQGVVDRATPEEPLQLRVFSPNDARSLGVSPIVATRRLWMWGGGVTALLALFSGWIVVLRRSNQAKTEAAALLEQKVHERTVELRHAQGELSKALDHERELGELKSRFVSMVSHEFRTPLGVTMSAVEIMRQFDAQISPAKRRELCDEIYQSTCNMAGLMEQVLLLSRVEAGKVGVKFAPVDVDGFTRKIIDELQTATSGKCPILWQPEGDLSGARCDEAILKHILSNLIVNSVKYSPGGNEVKVRAHRSETDVVFEVADRGIGIPEKDLLHLYDAFHRGENVSHIPGTGLGLVIVKSCVELHRGLITVKSEVDRGTTFTVRLPAFAASLPGSLASGGISQ